MDDEVKALFSIRDRAIKKQNSDLFLVTQVSDLEASASMGYFDLTYLTTDVLHIYQESEIECVVMVKETFGHHEEDYHHEILMYRLIHTVQGWKIYKVQS